jgi:hypothetical protein
MTTESERSEPRIAVRFPDIEMERPMTVDASIEESGAVRLEGFELPAALPCSPTEEAAVAVALLQAAAHRTPCITPTIELLDDHRWRVTMDIGDLDNSDPTHRADDASLPRAVAAALLKALEAEEADLEFRRQAAELDERYAARYGPE